MVGSISGGVNTLPMKNEYVIIAVGPHDRGYGKRFYFRDADLTVCVENQLEFEKLGYKTRLLRAHNNRLSYITNNEYPQPKHWGPQPKNDLVPPQDMMQELLRPRPPMTPIINDKTLAQVAENCRKLSDDILYDISARDDVSSILKEAAKYILREREHS